MKKLFLSACSIVALTAFSAQAENSVEDKLKRVERRIVAMERQVYSGKAGRGAISSDNQLLADTQAKLQKMQEDNAKLYGKVEELGYAVEKLAEQVKLMSDDFDFRLTHIEKNGVKPNIATKASNKATNIAKTDKTTRIKSKVPTKLSADKLYEKAFAYLSSTEFEKAQDWFEAFIERYPDHNLADNAYYWLGEVHLVQNDAKGAILAFSKGLKSFPNGSKASANLLKIGVAFKRIGQNSHAKSSWNKLLKDFPDTPEAAKAIKMLEELK